MTHRKDSLLSSPDSAARAWRLEQAQVDSAIAGLKRNPILDAYVAQLKAQGCTDEDIIQHVIDFDLTSGGPSSTTRAHRG